MRNAIVTFAAVAIIAGGATSAGARARHHHKAHAAFDINSTSWEFTQGGEAKQESIGPDGKYVIHSGAKHLDHGTVVMKASKACFTSLMNTDGEMCWTTHPTAIGATLRTVSDKGEKLAVKRVKYTPPKM